jgi:hypothetical protein
MPGSAFDTSFPEFHYRDWNWAEMMRMGIIRPLASYNIRGVCQCGGCTG